MLQARAAVLHEIGRPMAIERIALCPLQPGVPACFRTSMKVMRAGSGCPGHGAGLAGPRRRITGRLSLAQVHEGFAALQRGAAIRSVVMSA